MGFTDLSKKKTSADGSASISIESPLSTFGELLVSSLTTIGQGDFVYNVNNQIFTNRQFAGGSLTVSDGMAVLDSGVNPYGSAVVQLRRGLKYKPGQGSLMRASALFDTPSAGNAQFIGLGTAETGYFIGYFGGYFGILHSEDGQREIQKLTITTGAATGNVTVTLDGDSIVVPITITGGTSPEQTAYQLSLQDYSQVGQGGWLADVIGDSVYFLSARSGPMGGSYSVAGSSIVGAFSQVKAGIAQTNTFIPSTSFNIDTLDGTGPSGMTLNPQTGNVYQIGFQYLGFGNAKFYVENPNTGRPHQFHEIKNANVRTTPVLKNPNVNVLATCANIGGTTAKQLKTASIAGYVEGDLVKLDPKFALSQEFTNFNSSTYKPLILIKSNRTFHGDSCYGEIDLLEVGAGNDASAKTLIVGFFLNAKVSGDVNYQYVDQNQSIVSYANLDPGVNTITTTESPFFELVVGGGNAKSRDIANMQFVFGPGSNFLIAIKNSTGTAGNISGVVSIDWYEQQ